MNVLDVPTTQAGLDRYCRTKLTAALQRIDEVTRNLDEEALLRPRNDGGWSIAEVLAHMAVLNESYRKPMARAVQEAREMPVADADPPWRPSVAGADPPWRPSVAGRLISWSVRTPRRLKTPRIWEPERPDASSTSLQQFVESQQALLDLLDRSRTLEWRRIRLSSPASAVVRVNLGDCFRVLAEHAERHVNEVQRRGIVSRPDTT